MEIEINDYQISIRVISLYSHFQEVNRVRKYAGYRFVCEFEPAGIKQIVRVRGNFLQVVEKGVGQEG